MGAGAPAHVASVEGDMGEETTEALRAAGFPIRVCADLDEAVGQGQLVRRAANGAPRAAADPRSDGSAVSC
ncbi:hypothetical protein [Embleya sp. NBC_00896]|uniref:hypothetical protein n=1 Tax=Embleya sp. NBC_00896 TaxID=2975961 RepID=UPI002F91A5A5|nr:hypothetical protein OG928_43680 [Embleya sp. NBC_00896]